MIVVIPLGGIGQRFKDNNYNNPKALIDVCNKPIISHLLDNLNLDIIELVLIPYNKEYQEYKLEDFLINSYPNISFKFYCLENNTRGAAETLNIFLDKIITEQSSKCNNYTKSKLLFDKPILCLDSDNFYLCDIINQWNGSNCVFTFKDYTTKPIFSYIIVDKNDIILDIKEKEKISDNACTGAYGFASYYELFEYTNKIINENITQKKEFYTSGVIKEMLNNGFSFKNINILNKNYFSLGTPEQVKQYENPYIFDLDGTLVNTDDIYVKVWNNIMKKYNLSVDNNFFNFFIQGKNDTSFLELIFKHINSKEIIEISDLKDKLFVEYLTNTNKDIMIDGAYKFIQLNSNRRMGIVTSSNRSSAEFILEKTNLKNYMQFLITSEDCNKHKPDKEPYQKAINILQCGRENCTIFEDSSSGYKSAISLGKTNICIIINDNSSEFIKNINNYKISSYHDFNASKLNIDSKNNINIVLTEMLNKLLVKDVIFNDYNLKTGYICDIKSLKLIYNDTIENVVLKIENEDNELSNVARQLDLYEKEVFFYEKLSNIMNIITPKFYCSLQIDNKKCILLEDLNEYQGIFNINLNNDIDTLLTVVKNISNMHNRFYFKNSKELTTDFLDVVKINDILYYKDLVESRFNKFMKVNNLLLNANDKLILTNIYKNYNFLLDKAGTFPLTFCHGDLKSPNIFYKKESNNTITPFFLDWQYIHLNKGISDIVFLLVESLDFNEDIVDIIIKYYFNKSNAYSKLSDLNIDFKLSLCIFPFFVMIWFGSENRENLLDKVFPINFMKNTLKYYNKYLNEDFFINIKNNTI